MTHDSQRHPTIRRGSRVKIHYTLSVEGKVVDSSAGRDPLSYVHGTGQIVKGLEECLAGLRAGESMSADVPPEKAYGPFNPEAVETLPFEAVENPQLLKVGRIIQGRTAGGTNFTARVRELTADGVTLDLNHPLAGRSLHFEVTVVAVEN